MLNKIVKLTLGATLALVFIGCGGSSESPRDIAVAYATKIAKGDESAFEFLKESWLDIAKLHAIKTKEVGGLKRIEIASERIQGNKAEVKAYMHCKNGSTETAYVKLQYIDGKWEVEL